MRQSFIGSTVAIVIGAISVGTQLSHLSMWVQMDDICGRRASEEPWDIAWRNSGDLG